MNYSYLCDLLYYRRRPIFSLFFKQKWGDATIIRMILIRKWEKCPYMRRFQIYFNQRNPPILTLQAQNQRESRGLSKRSTNFGIKTHSMNCLIIILCFNIFVLYTTISYVVIISGVTRRRESICHTKNSGISTSVRID